MTSKIIVNNIEADSGISSITFNDSIFIGDINSTGTSTFNVVSGVSTIGVTTVHLTGINDLNYPTAGPLSNRNLIVNGAMRISQRGTSTTGINDLNTIYTTVDRGYHAFNGLGTWTSTQESDGPNGFTKSWKVNCTSPDPSPDSGDYAILVYRVEAQDLQVLEYGTSNAQTTTFSFYVKSNKTGSASIEFAQVDNSSKQYIATYTINSANTWEYKTITIPGDASGVINDDNGVGMQIAWWLNSGSNYRGEDSRNVWEAVNTDARNNTNFGLGGTSNDYFQITGIQWELGSQSTPFEHRSYADDLARCQRYYQGVDVRNESSYYYSFGTASFVNAARAYATMSFVTEMRDVPTAIDSSAASTFYVNSGGSAITNFTSIAINLPSKNSGIVQLDGATGATAGFAGRWLNNNNNTGFCFFDAEMY